MISHFPFILGFEVYYFKGDKDTPKDNFIVHFELNNKILVDDFEKTLFNKLKDVIDNE